MSLLFSIVKKENSDPNVKERFSDFPENRQQVVVEKQKKANTGDLVRKNFKVQ